MLLKFKCLRHILDLFKFGCYNENPFSLLNMSNVAAAPVSVMSRDATTSESPTSEFAHCISSSNIE